jgi:hypothetical protein
MGGGFAAVCVGGIVALWMLRPAGFEMPDLITATLLAVALAICGLSAAQNLRYGYRHRATLLVLVMACGLAIGYEAIWGAVQEKQLDRVRFYRKLCERLHERPLLVLGDSANEAVWYLDRPDEKIQNAKFPHLKAHFFESPGTVLLAGEKYVSSVPALREATRIESELLWAGETYYLLLPNAQHPPDPRLFEPRAKREQASEADD